MPKKSKKLKLWTRKRPKKRKFKAPVGGLKPSGSVKQISHAGEVRYHEGYVYDQLRYTMLTANQIADTLKDKINATLKTTITGPEAMTLPSGDNDWRCTILDQRGRCLLLAYKGIEAAVFYQRQLTEIKLQAGDRFPEGVMQDPKDAWQRLDLLGSSAKQKNVVLTNIHQRLEDENKLLNTRVQTLEALNDELEKSVKRLKSNNADMEDKIKAMSKRKRKK